MKKFVKKWTAMSIVAIMTVSALAGCGNSSKNDPTSTPKPTTAAAPTGTDSNEPTQPEATPIPEVDLGGMEIVIADWWSGAPKKLEDMSAQEEARYYYLQEVQEKYNFTIRQEKLSEWGDPHKENFSISTIAEDPMAQVWLMAMDWVQPLIDQGLCYDLATLDNIDFTEDKWIAPIVDQFSRGNSSYGAAWGRFEPGMGVYFNKRLLKEAGIDPELPYDLQAKGEWTWDEFENLLKQLTIDKDNDGIPDTYGMASFSARLFEAAALSNDAKFIGKREDGKYYNATTEPQLLEALQWVCGLIEKGYEMPDPNTGDWAWFDPAYVDAKAAFQVGGEYQAGSLKDSMEDDYGFVLFPKGPKADNYRVAAATNVAVIPSCYDKETAEKIAFALNLWANPTPGYENDWQVGYYDKHRDTRAVDETITKMYEPGVGVTNYNAMVNGIDIGAAFYWDLYALGATPSEKIEACQSAWQVYIDEANSKQ